MNECHDEVLDQYTASDDTVLENLQGLTTLKIYQTDAASMSARTSKVSISAASP